MYAPTIGDFFLVNYIFLAARTNLPLERKRHTNFHGVFVQPFHYQKWPVQDLQLQEHGCHRLFRFSLLFLEEKESEVVAGKNHSVVIPRL
jgi:hypothetical protein